MSVAGHADGVRFAAFETSDALLAAARRVRDEGHEVVDAHTPRPVEGLEEVLGLRRTRIRWLVPGAALAGGALAYIVQWWISVEAYPLNVGGRPLHSGPAFVLVAFEMAILAGSLAAFVAFFLAGGMPRLWHPAFEVDGFRRASVDRYWLVARPSGDGEVEGLEGLLRELGAEGVRAPPSGEAPGAGGAGAGGAGRDGARDDEAREDGARDEGTRGASVVLPLVLAASVAASAAGCESAGEGDGLDLERMVRQPSAEAYDEAPSLPGGQAMQPPPEGTVAHDPSVAPEPVRTGRSAEGAWLDAVPLEVDRALVERGRDRYASFCAPCHAADGNGNTPVAGAMEVRRPPSLHADPVRERPDGQLFDLVRGGIGMMPGYAYQLPVRDRWAVVAYVRALQRAGIGPVTPVTPALVDSLRTDP